MISKFFCLLFLKNKVQINKNNYRMMFIMSKQVLLPKSSSILPKIKISPNQIFALFAQRPSIVRLYFFCLCRCCCCCCRRCVVLFFWFLLVVVAVVVAVAVVCLFVCMFFFFPFAKLVPFRFFARFSISLTCSLTYIYFLVCVH